MTSQPMPFSSKCSYPVRASQDVQFLVDGEAAFAAIADEIEKAKEYVYVTCCYTSLNFRLRPPQQEQLLDLCKCTSGRGVQVALLFLQPVGWDGKPDNSVGGTVPSTRLGTITQIAPKVMARWDRAQGKGIYPAKLGCHHQKTFVIDGKVSFVEVRLGVADVLAHQFLRDLGRE